MYVLYQTLCLIDVLWHFMYNWHIKVLTIKAAVEYIEGVCCSMQYLDHLFERDPKCGGVYHERQVELYAKFDSDKLLPFLQSCSDIPLQNVSVDLYLFIGASVFFIESVVRA